MGITLFQSLETQERKQPGHTAVTLAAWQTEPGIVPGAQVGEQGEVLKHHADAPSLRNEPGTIAGDQLLTQMQRPPHWSFEACNQAKQRRFSATGRPEQTQQFSGSHLEVDATKGPGFIRLAIAMPDIVQRNR